LIPERVWCGTSESLAIGVAGAAAGVGVGFAGVAIIATVAPTLSATDGSAIGAIRQVIQNGSTAPTTYAVSVPLSLPVTAGVIVLAALLAMAGALLAGALADRPAAARRRAGAGGLTRAGKTFH
jgi:putative ABC transport system permease protein